MELIRTGSPPSRTHREQSQRVRERSEPKKTHAGYSYCRFPWPCALAPLAVRAGTRASRLLVSRLFCSLFCLNSDRTRHSETPPTLSALYFFSSRAGAGAGRGRWETTDAKSRLTTRPGPRPCVAGAACLLDAAVRRSVAGWCQVRSVVSDMCAYVGRAKGGSHRM